MPNYNVAVKFSGRFLLCTANNGGSFQSVARYNLLTLGNEVHLYGFSICRKVIKLSKQQIKKLLLNLQYKKTYEQYRRTYYEFFVTQGDKAFVGIRYTNGLEQRPIVLRI
jgi:hypothetical protein